MTANSDYFDAAIRHQIGIRNFTSGEIKRVLKILEDADRELVAKLRERLVRLGSVEDFTSKRLKALLDDMQVLRNEAMLKLRQQVSPTLFELARMEAQFETNILNAAIPIEVSLASASAETLRAVVTKRPFQGALLRSWYQGLANRDKRNLRDAIQQGLAQGESTQQIVRRVAGTRASRFTDGALAITRRNAEAVVRTAVNHVTNGAREAVWDANSDVISGLRWTSTLDGRTSGVCQARDGKVAPINGPLPSGFEPLVPAGARPPAHINCRSVMVGMIDGEALVERRPFVVDTRTRQRREIDFRAMARRQKKPIAQVRKEWADKNIGQVPARTTYDSFLRRQTVEFQNEVLGPTKAKLFRAGERLDRFVDRRGNELTLEQLSRTRPEVFERAGLDPEDF